MVRIIVIHVTLHRYTDYLINEQNWSILSYPFITGVGKANDITIMPILCGIQFRSVIRQNVQRT